ncbi:MAG: hypothetical protein M3O30_03395 [Planctomycetota bacterium]|nr:hypothetical protein [Planctomycetota bacterium]
MAPKSASNQPHTASDDYNEGPQAVARFREAVSHLAKLPKSAIPARQPQAKQKRKKK